MGNYFTDENGARCLITSRELAEKYSQLVGCPIYVQRPTKRAPDEKPLGDFIGQVICGFSQVTQTVGRLAQKESYE